MRNSEIRKLIEVIIKSNSLKNVKRTGWILEGIKGAESVADHTWGTSFLALLLANPKELDVEKLLKMIVVHDLGEITPGDIKWESGKKVIGSQKIKRKTELNTLKELFKALPKKDEYLQLLQEFNEQTSPEAKFLKQIEKLEMATQAYVYEQRGYSKKSLNQFWENTEKYLEGQELEPIFRELMRMRKKLL